MNQLEEMREKCANVAQQYANNAYNNSSQNAAMEIRDAIRALPLPEVKQEPTDLHYKIDLPRAVIQSSKAELKTEIEALRKENEQLRAALNSILRMDVKGHQLQYRLQFSTAGRAILDQAMAALKGGAV